MPSRAPNSLCPRFRSSVMPFLRRSAALLERSEGGEPPLPVSGRASRGRLAPESEFDDCLRLADSGGEASCSLISSGMITAEAIALTTRQKC